MTHSINDILALDGLFKINDILVVHHTDCGTLRYTDAGIRDVLKARLPGHESSAVDGMEFGAIKE